MARIEFQKIGHSYPGSDEYALHPTSRVWKDGGAYALLGPSGCGKTTLLNICSGLLRPSEGRLLFDGEDVTDKSIRERNMPQVFQFPVIYDTMSVYENLAFPLKNRGWAREDIRRRVHEIADVLELGPMLNKSGAGLSADLKQKVSMGRGLVRQDVAAILFDEPLTVIDPQLKWQLRRSLKEIHNRLKFTFIYVTHDQAEALTLADRVVVMSAGQVLQEDTPQELFENPAHTFVGHFIGSPGMNFLPCRIEGHQALLGNDVRMRLPDSLLEATKGRSETLKLGIRPEFIRLVNKPDALPVKIDVLEDMGRARIVTFRLGEHQMICKVPEEAGPIDTENPRVEMAPEWIRLYADEQLIAGGKQHG